MNAIFHRRFRSGLLAGLLLTALCRGGVVAADPPLLSDEDRAGIEQVLEQLGQALRDSDGRKLQQSFDTPRLIREIQSHGVWQDLGGVPRFGAVLGINSGLRQVTPRLALRIGWKRHQIRDLRVADGGGEVRAMVRVWHIDGERLHLHLWLVRTSPGQWRVFDLQDTEIGIRISASMAAALAADEQSALWLRHVHQFLEAGDAMALFDWDRAEALLGQLENVQLPDWVEAQRLIFQAVLKQVADEHHEAIELTRLAEVLLETAQGTQVLRGWSQYHLGDYVAATETARQFLAAAGPDADGYNLLGHALLALERTDEALQAFRAGLADDPDDMDMLLMAAELLPENGRGELIEWYHRLNDPQETFIKLCDALSYLPQWAETVERVIAAHRQQFPEDVASDYYLAMLRSDAGDDEQAAAILQAAVLRTAEPPPYLIWEWIHRMVSLGRALEAYAAAPDPVYAFEAIGDILVDLDDADTLQALLLRHVEKHPEDPWGSYYAGAIHIIRGQYAEADEALAAAMAFAAQKQREEVVSWSRRLRVRARVLAGNALSAYHEIEPKELVFEQLVDLLIDAGAHRELQRLIDARRADAPDDPLLPLWQAEARWLRHDYAGCARILQEHFESLSAEPYHFWRVEDRLVRSLLRSGQLEAALRAAAASTSRDGDPYYEALVHCAAGRVEPAAQAMQTCLDQGYLLWSFYNDRDFAMHIHGPKLKELRRRFPEPVEALDGQ